MRGAKLAKVLGDVWKEYLQPGRNREARCELDGVLGIERAAIA